MNVSWNGGGYDWNKFGGGEDQEPKFLQTELKIPIWYTSGDAKNIVGYMQSNYYSRLIWAIWGQFHFLLGDLFLSLEFWILSLL